MAILLTVLPLLKSGNWIIRLGDFPRLQIAITCLILIIVILFVFEINWFVGITKVVLMVCFAYQLSKIFPYTPFAKKQVLQTVNGKKESRIKVLISNVLIENRNCEQLLKRIEEVNPDVILLAEIDDWWKQAIKSIKQEYLYNIEYPLDNAYGIGFYSRLKTQNCKLNFWIEDDIPSVESEIFLRSGEKIKFYGLHPRPPMPTEKSRSTERDAELLLVGKIIKKSNLPTIVCGDLNDVAWSDTNDLFQKISGLLDARIGRGFYNSFHAKHWFMRMPLDHVFQSNHFHLVSLKRLKSIGSDHFPIFIELSLEKIAEKMQEELEANGDEKKEADRKIKEDLD